MPAGGGLRAWFRSYRWPVIAGFTGVLLTITAVTAAAAWPRDRDNGTPAAGGGSAGSAATATVAQAEVLWKVNSGVAAAEPPAVSTDHIVVSGQDGSLRSFRRADGALEWTAPVGQDVRASTRIFDGAAYATTGDGSVAAIDVASGDERWRKSTGKPIKARPVTDDQRVFVGGSDGVLTAYEIKKGGRRWRVFTEGEISTLPTVINGIVVVASGDGKLYGVGGTGALLWKTGVGRVTGGPVAAGSSVCVPVDDGSVRCVRIPGGAALPAIRDDVALTRVYGGNETVGSGIVFAAGEDGSITAWDTTTGKLTWRYRSPAGKAEAGYPALRTAASEVDVTFPDGRLVGLDATSGEVRWRNATGDSFTTGPRGDDAGVFAVGESGTVYALRPPGSTGAVPAASTSPPTASVTPPPATQTEAEREPATRSTHRRTTKATTTYTYRSTKPSPSETTPTKPTTPPTTATTETAPAADPQAGASG